MIPRSQLIVALIAAFLFGVTSGALGGFAASMLTQRHPRFDGPRRGERIMRFELHGPMSRDLARRLDLSPAQSERFQAIMSESGERYKAVRESTRVALERELTPEQRVQFRQMEHRFVRHRLRERRSPPWQDRRSHWEIDTIIEGEIK